jgi:CRP/FNR family transcriptional regulator, cyclic AMP receptor protein
MQQNTQATPQRSQNDAEQLLAKYCDRNATADYRKNRSIYVQGQVADAVHFIQKGRVKLTATSEQGKEAVVAILGEGQFFGEGCLNDQPLRTASATAMPECRVTSIAKSVMLSAIHDDPQFSSMFMDHLLSRNSRIEADVVDQLFNSSEKRLARLLLLLANYGKEGSPPIVPVTVSQETLAAMIGTTRSRVSYFMNKFRKSGFIDYNGQIEVHQSLLNSLLHEHPEIRKDEPA